MSGEEASALRIGNAERSAALQALDDHLAAGRLGVEEYADRSAAAMNAVFASDLATLFTDLPEPHPPLPGMPGMPVSPRAHRSRSTPVQSERAPGLPGRWGPILLVASVVAAIGLLLVTRQGVVILLIPLVAVLLWASRNG
jgi:hypothetical protein